MDNQIKYEGTLNLGENKLPCYVLEDGTRVLSGRKMQEILKVVDGNISGTKLPQFLSNSILKPFIFSNKDAAHFDPIICFKGKQRINGYEATVLTDICEAILSARRSGVKMTERQQIVANQCEILLSSFAKIGIIALIDEATGYQNEREHFELQKILSAYISEEILKWQLTFTDDFYREVYRLWGLPFIPKYIKNKPSFIGKLTTKYIYDLLPDGVVDKIKEKTGKTDKGNWKYKWHQSLTPEIGREHLKKQIIEVTTLMSISKSKSEFNELFERKYNAKPIQLELEFNEDINEVKSKSNDDFDKGIDKIIGFEEN
ncbi:P63C domain-containing protein [Phocaeicola vulgatus]|jgi:hypothetical protein|uniref:P63C domain-containing protein n=1 Tax=Phocaeicola vulgatus TaxID=821 RepID=UPI000E44DFBF|nr:P63C domain-containing protein [Phocaeicola vulgatus]MCG0350557.1 P63C domain-containing protein [Phocaeicola vulgatus]MDB0811952.1 P63C domain-containing protein [Phocaeicola vulgatus]RGM79933.1 hypothetical protein DXB90_18215 [Phocaeicola vulgatus]RGN05342.1 hypothetical protein DXB82_09680 [Phocaeicola vulgatus]